MLTSFPPCEIAHSQRSHGMKTGTRVPWTCAPRFALTRFALGPQARDRGDLVQKSLEFREWAATSCHLVRLRVSSIDPPFPDATCAPCHTRAGGAPSRCPVCQGRGGGGSRRALLG